MGPSRSASPGTSRVSLTSASRRAPSPSRSYAAPSVAAHPPAHSTGLSGGPSAYTAPSHQIVPPPPLFGTSSSNHRPSSPSLSAASPSRSISATAANKHHSQRYTLPTPISIPSLNLTSPRHSSPRVTPRSSIASLLPSFGRSGGYTGGNGVGSGFGEVRFGDRSLDAGQPSGPIPPGPITSASATAASSSSALVAAATAAVAAAAAAESAAAPLTARGSRSGTPDSRRQLFPGAEARGTSLSSAPPVNPALTPATQLHPVTPAPVRTPRPASPVLPGDRVDRPAEGEWSGNMGGGVLRGLSGGAEEAGSGVRDGGGIGAMRSVQVAVGGSGGLGRGKGSFSSAQQQQHNRRWTNDGSAGGGAVCASPASAAATGRPDADMADLRSFAGDEFACSSAGSQRKVERKDRCADGDGTPAGAAPAAGVGTRIPREGGEGGGTDRADAVGGIGRASMGAGAIGGMPGIGRGTVGAGGLRSSAEGMTGGFAAGIAAGMSARPTSGGIPSASASAPGAAAAATAAAAAAAAAAPARAGADLAVAMAEAAGAAEAESGSNSRAGFHQMAAKTRLWRTREPGSAVLRHGSIVALALGNKLLAAVESNGRWELGTVDPCAEPPAGAAAGAVSDDAGPCNDDAQAAAAATPAAAASSGGAAGLGADSAVGSGGGGDGGALHGGAGALNGGGIGGAWPVESLFLLVCFGGGRVGLRSLAADGRCLSAASSADECHYFAGWHFQEPEVWCMPPDLSALPPAPAAADRKDAREAQAEGGAEETADGGEGKERAQAGGGRGAESVLPVRVVGMVGGSYRQWKHMQQEVANAAGLRGQVHQLRERVRLLEASQARGSLTVPPLVAAAAEGGGEGGVSGSKDGTGLGALSVCIGGETSIAGTNSSDEKEWEQGVGKTHEGGEGVDGAGVLHPAASTPPLSPSLAASLFQAASVSESPILAPESPLLPQPSTSPLPSPILSLECPAAGAQLEAQAQAARAAQAAREEEKAESDGGRGGIQQGFGRFGGAGDVEKRWQAQLQQQQQQQQQQKKKEVGCGKGALGGLYNRPAVGSADDAVDAADAAAAAATAAAAAPTEKRGTEESAVSGTGDAGTKQQGQGGQQSPDMAWLHNLIKEARKATVSASTVLSTSHASPAPHAHHPAAAKRSVTTSAIATSAVTTCAVTHVGHPNPIGLVPTSDGTAAAKGGTAGPEEAILSVGGGGGGLLSGAAAVVSAGTSEPKELRHSAVEHMAGASAEAKERRRVAAVAARGGGGGGGGGVGGTRATAAVAVAEGAAEREGSAGVVGVGEGGAVGEVGVGVAGGAGGMAAVAGGEKKGRAERGSARSRSPLRLAEGGSGAWCSC
ncbi:unnamed protein product [Closterium sp. Yama58-4]|nr:unnamed protein product [Closterium sp. Yama58-4]